MTEDLEQRIRRAVHDVDLAEVAQPDDVLRRAGRRAHARERNRKLALGGTTFVAVAVAVVGIAAVSGRDTLQDDTSARTGVVSTLAAPTAATVTSPVTTISFGGSTEPLPPSSTATTTNISGPATTLPAADTPGFGAVATLDNDGVASYCSGDPTAPPSLPDGSPPGEPAIAARDLVRSPRSAVWAQGTSNEVWQVLDVAIDPAVLDAALADGSAHWAADVAATTEPVDGGQPAAVIYLGVLAAQMCDYAYIVTDPAVAGDAEALAARWVAERSLVEPAVDATDDPIGPPDMFATVYDYAADPVWSRVVRADEYGEILAEVDRDEAAARASALFEGRHVHTESPGQPCFDVPVVEWSPEAGAQPFAVLPTAASTAMSADGVLVAIRSSCPDGAMWGDPGTYQELVRVELGSPQPSIEVLTTLEPVLNPFSDTDPAVGWWSDWRVGNVAPGGRFATLYRSIHVEGSVIEIRDLDRPERPMEISGSCESPAHPVSEGSFLDATTSVVALVCPDRRVIVDEVDLNTGEVIWTGGPTPVQLSGYQDQSIGVSASLAPDGHVVAIVSGNGVEGPEYLHRSFLVGQAGWRELRSFGRWPSSWGFEPVLPETVQW